MPPPPSGPSTPIPTGPASLRKPPPSGPRSHSNPSAPPTGPSASRPTPVAIPFGATKFRRGGGAGSGPGPSSYHHQGFGRSSSQYDGVPTGPQAESGRHGGSSHAESSRQALAKSTPSRGSHDLAPGRTTTTTTTPRSRQRSTTPPSGPRSSRPVDEEDASFRAKMLPTQTPSSSSTSRIPISIAFPSLKVNGTATPEPPNLPPPPPSDRPPTPPISPTKPPVATPPPPPDEDEVDRPPPPPTDSSSPPPPPTTNEEAPRPPTPPAPMFQPIKIALPTRPAGHSEVKEVPPAFHFRNIPVRRRSPTPEDESASEEEARPTPRRTSSPPPPPREVTLPPPPRDPTPPPPPKEPAPPPYEPPPYVPPPSTSHRPGLGNFRVLHDPAVDDPKKGGKEIKKRIDGEGVQKVVDPRLGMPLDVRNRGKGSAKQRTEFYEVSYDWDSNSVGSKPLPPPCAVLITGLNPLTTTDQIGKYLRPHGRIREMDAKMDTKSGMQLGICWVKFDAPPSSSGKTANDIANAVVRACDGQRIRVQGDERIRVVLDGRGLRAQKAVKEEMDRRYKPKPKPTPVATPVPPAGPKIPTGPSGATPSSGGADTPKTDPPLGPSLKSTPAGLPNRPTPRAVPFFNNRNYASLNRAQPIRPPIPPSSLPSRPAPAAAASAQRPAPNFNALPYVRGDRYVDLRDSWSPRRDRSRSRSRSRSHSPGCSTCSSFYSDSESEDDRYYRPRRRRTPSPRRAPRQVGPSKEDEEAIEKVKKALADNGKSHIFIDEKTLSTKDASMSAYLMDHFRSFHPEQILKSPKGWYILFDKEGVAQNAAVLNGMSFRGNRLTFVAEVPASAAVRQATTTAHDNADGAGATGGQKAWRFLTITKKNRPVRPPSPKKVARRRAPSFSSSSGSVSDASEPAQAPVKKTARDAPAKAVDEVKDKEEDKVVVDDLTVGKKRAGKTKVSAKTKKAKLDPAPLVEIAPLEEPPVAEIDLQLPAPTSAAPSPTKGKPKKAAPSPLDKLIESGTVIDEEDAYWLGQALQESEPVDEEAMAEEEAVQEDHPLYHTSGSWRAEGFKSIPKIRKSEYLPQQNKAAVSAQETSALTSGRTARVTGRRLAHDIETTRKSTITSDTDTFAFNQLRTRKKQLKFSRSPIEGYGLYAMETIYPNEMVCEYVGEIVRSAVADVREMRYLKQGIGSSYLFRIDGDVVCDATFRGSVSRLINHSCDPSASAKIITINGQSKIVIYAKTTLHPGQEILYDYKFPLEEDPALRVPCLCGAPTCRGWLN